MLLPRVLRPLPVPGALPMAGPPGRSPLTLVKTRRGGFIGAVLARLIADDGRWDGCAWLREPSGDPGAAQRSMVEALALRSGADPSRWGEVSMTEAMRRCGPGSVLVVQMTRRCTQGLGHLLARAQRYAEQAGTEIVVATGDSVPRVLRARTTAIALDTTEYAAAECRDLGLGDDVIDRVRRLTRGQSALLYDLAQAGQPSELIAVAATDAHTARGFLRRVTDLFLDTAAADELEALEIAVRTGYWHPQFSAGSVNTEMLRPWVVPLEHDWGWLRPVWRAVLATELPRKRNPPLASRTASPQVEALAPDAWKPVLEVRLLGDFEMRIDGHRVPRLESPLSTSLLRFMLARPGRSCPRDVLLETFWPGSDPGRARNRLQAAFSALRRSIREATDVPVIEFSKGSYRISPDVDLVIDLTEFEQLAARANRAHATGDTAGSLAADRKAARLYRGDLCSDLPYEEWTIFLRERVRLVYGDVLDRLATNQWHSEDYNGCIATAERMLEQDPCREDAHRLLMQCYSAMGRSHQAMRQFASCRRVLAATLGTNPSRATVATYLEIRDRGD